MNDTKAIRDHYRYDGTGVANLIRQLCDELDSLRKPVEGVERPRIGELRTAAEELIHYILALESALARHETQIKRVIEASGIQLGNPDPDDLADQLAQVSRVLIFGRENDQKDIARLRAQLTRTEPVLQAAQEWEKTHCGFGKALNHPERTLRDAIRACDEGGSNT